MGAVFTILVDDRLRAYVLADDAENALAIARAYFRLSGTPGAPRVEPTGGPPPHPLHAHLVEAFGWSWVSALPV